MRSSLVGIFALVLLSSSSASSTADSVTSADSTSSEFLEGFALGLESKIGNPISCIGDILNTKPLSDCISGKDTNATKCFSIYANLLNDCAITNITVGKMEMILTDPIGYLRGRAKILLHAPELITDLQDFRTNCAAKSYLACGDSLGKFVGIFVMNPPEDIPKGSDTVPSQLHLALGGVDSATGSPIGMTMAWYTKDPAPTTVQYGLSESALSLTAYGTSREYLPGYGFHHAVYADCSTLLPKGQRVYYRVGTQLTGWSDVLSFSTNGWSADAAVKVATFGDMGFEDTVLRPMVITTDMTKKWSAVYARQTLEELLPELDMVFHIGDISYADDSFAHAPLSFTYESILNGYMDWMQNLTATMPYMVSPGNHESECHSPACILHLETLGKPLSNFSAYNTRFHMPSEESGGAQSMWYSFNYGPAHFVSLNTETDFPGAGEEKTGDSGLSFLPAGGFGADGEYLAWLEADLKKASEARDSGSPSGRPWLVAGGHRPWDDIQATVGPLFDKYGVDVYFAGHKHSYCRSAPAGLQASTTVPTQRGVAPLYTSWNRTMWVTTGGAGCEEMKEGTAASPADWGGCVKGWDTFFTARYSMGMMTMNSTHLTWELLDAEKKTLLDAFVLTK